MSADRLITDPEFRDRQRERYETLKALRVVPRMFWPRTQGTYCVFNNAYKAAIREDRERSR